MTIGAIARSQAVREGEENEDFKVLKGERDRIEEEFKEVCIHIPSSCRLFKFHSCLAWITGFWKGINSC